MKMHLHTTRIFFFIACMAMLFPLRSQNGFVHVEKGKLVDGNNASLKLDGVNLGGWLLWEGWIWGGKFKKEGLIKSRMKELFGKEQAEKYITAYYNSFITEQDIKAIAAQGMNVVRLPVNHNLFEKDEAPGVIKPGGFSYIDSTIAWGKRHKVYVVIDLHATPGGQSPYFISDPDKNNLWEQPQNKTRTVAVWKALAERYKDEKWVAGYDLLNEPIPKKDEELLQLYRELVETIRREDKNHLLILEGKVFATNFGFFDAVLDPNQLFSFHFYTWFTANPPKKLQGYSEEAQRFGVPMWCGEWGEHSPEKIKSNRVLLNDPAYGFCGSAFWTWKRVEKDPNRPALNRVNVSAESADLINWLSGSGTKPETEAAKKAMEDFIAALTLDKTKANGELYRILKPGN